MSSAIRRAVVPFLAVALAGLVFTATQVGATHQPANKVSAAGSTEKVFGPGEEVVLLSEKIKANNPTDLILGVTLECVITTELTTVGNETESASGTVEVWVELDGVAVPVSEDDTVDPGKVTFCNKIEQRQTSMFDDLNATIRTLNTAGAANGFNWLRLNAGTGIQLIEVKATLTTDNTDPANAAATMAAVGKRTLIIEPVKAANDEEVTRLNS